MEDQDQGARGGDLNNTEEVEEVQQQQQLEGTTDDPKVESEDEGTGQDLPENSGDEEPVIKEQVAEELIEVKESEFVVEEKEKEVNDIGSGEEVQELGNEELQDKKVKEDIEEPLQEKGETDHNKENHINGTSEPQNNHFEAEEQLTKEEEENNKNREQEIGDIVDFKEKEVSGKQEECQQSISELKSKWDSFGKEHSSPIDHTHKNEGDNMADTTKTSRFGGTVEKCNQCQKTVYAMERMEVAGRLMHKTCFRCCKCNSPLSVGRFSVGGGELYCMTHYKQAFREKGTYDVFTPDNPIKGKWQNKPAE